MLQIKKFDSNSFRICADSVASSGATPDEIYFIPGTYKHLTGVKINGITEGLKVAGCRSVSWIFQDDKKENIELIIEQDLHIPGLLIRIISPQQVAKYTGKIGDGLHAEKDEAHLTFGGFKFTTKYKYTSGLPIYISVNNIYQFKACNMELHQYNVNTVNLTLEQRSLLKWHRLIGHMDFWSIIRFTRLGLIPFALTTTREEDIPRCSEFCFGKQSCTCTKTDSSGANIADEHDQPGMWISIDLIESTQGVLIPVLKRKQTSRKYHAATLFDDHFSKRT